MRITVRNAGPAAATVQVLPTLWFRNTWDWTQGEQRPTLQADGDHIVAIHPELGTRVLDVLRVTGALFCENTTNVQRLYGAPATTPYPKDGINDYLVHGAATVNPEQRGTKGALAYRLEIAPGESAEVRVRLAPAAGDVGAGFDEIMTARAQEADAFYAPLAPGRRDRRREDDHAAGLRRAVVVQAVLPLRRAPVAGRRPGTAAAARATPCRARPRLEAPARRRHHRDARRLGVPVVRCLGPGVPLRSRWLMSTRRWPSSNYCC